MAVFIKTDFGIVVSHFWPSTFKEVTRYPLTVYNMHDIRWRVPILGHHYMQKSNKVDPLVTTTKNEKLDQIKHLLSKDAVTIIQMWQRRFLVGHFHDTYSDSHVSWEVKSLGQIGWQIRYYQQESIKLISYRYYSFSKYMQFITKLIRIYLSAYGKPCNRKQRYERQTH